ncbi:MAG: hypothetical protein ABWZ98_12745 [Nakamurella sp.]
MRWDRLFDDLEARFEELAEAEATAELADRERVAIGAIWMTQRLSGAIGSAVRVRLAGGPLVAGRLLGVGPDWLLLNEGQGRDCLVALSAVIALEGLTATTGRELSGLALRLDLRRALRGLARDRSPVALALTGWGGVTTGSGSVAGVTGSGEITGTIDRVGADFVEVAVHAAWEPRRAGAVRSVALLPVSAIVLVRALPLG